RIIRGLLLPRKRLSMRAQKHSLEEVLAAPPAVACRRFLPFADALLRLIFSWMLKNAPLVIAGREFRSRLLVGTGKFSGPEIMREALAASGTEIVTVALRRADLSGKKDPFANILEFIDP